MSNTGTSSDDQRIEAILGYFPDFAIPGATAREMAVKCLADADAAAIGPSQEAVNFGALVALNAAHCEWCEARMICPNGCESEPAEASGESS